MPSEAVDVDVGQLDGRRLSSSPVVVDLEAMIRRLLDTKFRASPALIDEVDSVGTRGRWVHGRPARSADARGFMSNAREKSLQEAADVLGRHEHAFDEPESVQLMASVRAAGLLTDDEWQEVLVWLDEADDDSDGPDGMSPDDDPRNADWIRIAGAQRLSGHMLPSWAGLWLWWIGHDRDFETWWGPIGEAAESLGIQKFDVDW
jgi:hypothetical protein